LAKLIFNFPAFSKWHSSEVANWIGFQKTDRLLDLVIFDFVIIGTVLLGRISSRWFPSSLPGLLFSYVTQTTVEIQDDDFILTNETLQNKVSPQDSWVNKLQWYCNNLFLLFGMEVFQIN
jgi:hypothetical protein